MKIKLKKMLWIILILIVLGIIIQLSTVIGIEYHQSNQSRILLDSFKIKEQFSKTLVVYFSRSGSTELMAYQIAEIKNAALITLEAPDYKLGFKGWIRAMMNSRNTKARISNHKIDLTGYDTIYIGSPIWLYSPAPPVFEFVKNNDFTSKKVVLFNSLNSKFDQKYIDTFSLLVRKNGGNMIRHIYVIRGRMTQQINNKDFLDSVKTQVLN